MNNSAVATMARYEADDPANKEVSLSASIDGTTISYKKSGAGPPLVFFHGWIGNEDTFGFCHEAFARHFTVYRPAWPGYGASGPLGQFSIEHLVELGRGFIRALGYDRVTLFGNCLGGGLELPLACHFRLAAAAGAKIGLPELHLGTVPAWGGSARLVRRIGRDRAIDLILRAKTVDGPEALALGLVTEVWPNTELKQRAVDLAEELAAAPRLAVAAMLRCLVTSDGKTLDESLRDERAAVHATLGTPDSVEGLAAFMEKRPPRFNRS